MKNHIRTGLIITGFLALGSFCVSIYLVSALLHAPQAEAHTESAVRHFSLYLPQSRSSYFLDIIEGAMRSARENKAVLSVHTLDPGGVALQMATYTGVDGIVVCPDLDDDIVFEKLMRLSERKIPVVLVNHNIPADQPWAFVGTNNFDFGKKAASLIDQTNDTKLNLVVIYSQKSPAIFAERELVEMGLHSVLDRKLAGPILGQKTDMNPRDAEKIVYQIVRSRPEINTIVFTDLNDTLAGTQALIDLNQVGHIQVVGFGDDPAIGDFIQKGIIAGSLVVNPKLMGAQAVKSLTELQSTGYTSTTVDTGIDILHANNLQSWKYTRGRGRP
ncbi:MAG TPA: sugar ABC transporter substrate-binding protein [Treponema sp.]|nr:sugar ABC transporter substrate-binding protein [Treponema sp.]